MDSCFVLAGTHQHCVAKICNASQEPTHINYKVIRPLAAGKINARAECGGIQRTWFFTKICCVNVTEYQSATKVFKVNYFICVPSIVTN